MAVNPAGYIPALVDGDVTIVESIAIMEYLLGRYDPSPLARLSADPDFPAYQQSRANSLAAHTSLAIPSRLPTSQLATA
jgi:glutathione S-transferase